MGVSERSWESEWMGPGVTLRQCKGPHLLLEVSSPVYSRLEKFSATEKSMHSGSLE